MATEGGVLIFVHCLKNFIKLYFKITKQINDDALSISDSINRDTNHNLSIFNFVKIHLDETNICRDSVNNLMDFGYT